MNKFNNTLKTLEPTIPIILVLMFVSGLIVGQQTASREVKKHYIVDASEIEVVYHDPYKALTLETCTTDWECETAQLIADNLEGKLIRTDDPIFFPDSIPVVEPIDCEPKDKECLKQNANAGKSAHYPSICEPYISSNEHKEKTL